MRASVFLVLGVLGACGPLHDRPDRLAEAGGPARVAVEAVLDAYHAAASRADAAAYFGRMAGGAVFLGTDASERWDREAFRAYAEPYFSQGRGWTYRPLERHVWVQGTWPGSTSACKTRSTARRTAAASSSAPGRSSTTT